ncbi:hypothetical protein THH46_18525 [Pseudomonas sp. NA13]
MRLLGGAPPKRLADQRRQNARRAAELSQELENFLTQQVDQQRAIDVAQQVMTLFQDGSRYSEEQRAPKRKIYDGLLNEQTAIYLKLLDSAASARG